MCYRPEFKRNTRVFFLLQHLVRCAECGLLFGLQSLTGAPAIGATACSTGTIAVAPLRYYVCYGMQKHRLRCREHSFIKD